MKLDRVLSITLAAVSVACVEMERVPPSAEIQESQALQPFLVSPVAITGVYQNRDVDAVVFHYTSSIRDESEFWRRIEQQVQSAGWVNAKGGRHDPGQLYRSFERLKAQGELSFSSAEELRIAYHADRIAVAYIQSDQNGPPRPVAEASEGRFADDQIWPRFASLVPRKGGS